MSSEPPDLESLVHHAKEGDEAALEQLLEHCKPGLERLAARTCPPADAEDAVQEVLIRVSSSIGALRLAGAFTTWALRMVVRECLQLKRRAARWVFGEAVGTTTTMPDVSDLQRGLQKLNAPAREILLHRDLLGRTAKETAAVLGISVESAKSRLRRARHALRRALVE